MTAIYDPDEAKAARAIIDEAILTGKGSGIVRDILPRDLSIIRRDLSHVPTDKLRNLAETYERKLKIIGGSGNPEGTKLRFRFEFIMQEIGIRQIVEDVEADLAKVGQ